MILALVLLGSSPPPLVQEVPEKSSLSDTGLYAPAKPAFDLVELSFNFYDQDDNGGNPNQEESVKILQPMLLVTTSLAKDWILTMTLQGDVIMSDSSSGASGRAAAGTAAPPPGEDAEGAGEGKEGLSISEIQYAGTMGLSHRWSPWTTVGVAASYSQEENYGSLGATFRWVHELPDRNDTFSFRLTTLFDTVDLEYYDGTSGGEDERRTVSPGFGWTHVLTGRTLMTLNYDLTLQRGYLGTPSQSVVVGATETREELPDSRTRHSVHGRVRHLLFEPVAVEPGAGAYLDDWGARAYSVEFNLYWEAVARSLIVRPGFRFHSQSAVDFFVEEDATSAGRYHTQDSDLGEFTTRTVGLKLTFLKSPLAGDELEIGFDVASRSDGIDWFTVSVGFTWK